MADSYAIYSGDGTQLNWTVPFPYIDQSHVKVLVAGSEVAYTWVNANTVRYSPAAPVSSVVVVRRDTPTTSLTSFSNTNNLTAENLNLAETQVMFVSQEARDIADLSITLDLSTVQFNFDGKRGINVADPVNPQDAATKHFVETGVTSQLVLATTARTQAQAAQAQADADAAATASDRAAVLSDKTTISGWKDTISGWKDTISGWKDTISGWKDTVATNMATVAADKATVAADKATVAADKATVAADKDTVATDRAATHTDRLAADASAAAAAGYASSFTNGLILQGDWDASSGSFPGSGGAQIGWWWKVSVGGTVNGKTFGSGDSIIAKVNNASLTTFAGNWIRVEGELSASEVIAALGYTPLSNVLASQAEAEAGTENTKAMTALRTSQAIAQLVPVASQAEAEAGTINTKFMTPQRVFQAIAQYIANFFWSTGDVKFTWKTTADSGWIMVNDGTIGDASSGATYANANASALYTLIYNNFANTEAAVTGGRGASAAADFAAHKSIALPKALGRAIGLAGAGSGLTSRALGKTLGEETHSLTSGENGTHGHGVNDPGHAHGAADGSFFWTGYPSGNTAGGAGSNFNGTGIATGFTGISLQQSGSSTPHNVMQPTSFWNAMVKL